MHLSSRSQASFSLRVRMRLSRRVAATPGLSIRSVVISPGTTFTMPTKARSCSSLIGLPFQPNDPSWFTETVSTKARGVRAGGCCADHQFDDAENGGLDSFTVQGNV